MLRAWPRAGAQLQIAIPGANEPFDKKHWRIYREEGEISETIGIGPTEEIAWADAAKKLSELAMVG